MKKKNNSIPGIIALCLAVASLVLSGLSLASVSEVPEDVSHLVDDLYAENQALRQELESLTQRMDGLLTLVNLKSWTLDATAWDNGAGADVTFTAQPSQYQAGVSATLLVLLEGQQVACVPCRWENDSFIATAKLDSADGYQYYCQLASPGGTQQLPLAGPDMVQAGIPVYLRSALSAYCNLVVSDWIQKDGDLVLTDAYAQAQLPQLSTSGTVRMVSAELVLKLGGNDTARIPIQMTPSEVSGSFELVLRDVQLPMPILKGADSLELYLQIQLSDDRWLQAFGISWHMDGKELTSAVG